MRYGLLRVHIEHEHIVTHFTGRHCERARQGGFPDPAFLHSDSDGLHVHF